MNTCYCTRLPQPHSRTPECESHRIDRLIRRRETERQLWRQFPDGFSFDEWLDNDPDYKRQDREARATRRKN